MFVAFTTVGFLGFFLSSWKGRTLAEVLCGDAQVSSPEGLWTLSAMVLLPESFSAVPLEDPDPEVSVFFCSALFLSQSFHVIVLMVDCFSSCEPELWVRTSFVSSILVDATEV